MIPDFEIIERLYDLGHFFSPEALEVELVNRSDLPKLNTDDKVVKCALRSFQGFMAPSLDAITQRLGMPLGSHLGEADEPTKLLFEVPRCGRPDFEHPETARKLSGTGSWPDPCQKNGVKIFVDKSNMPASLASTIDSYIQAMIDANGSVGLKQVLVPSKSGANVVIVWQFLAGNTIGLSDFNNGSCSNQVLLRLDTQYTGPYMRTLLLHENGHNNNLQHTRGGIMNPVITPDPSPFGWHSDDPSHSTLVRFFGGEPVTPTPSPAPQPIPVPGPNPVPTPYGFLKLPCVITDADGKSFTLILIPK